MPIRNRPQRLQKIQFRKLKNLENLEISFENKHITGIFGTNGSGKSTILHALACLYQPVANSTRRNFKFPNFFIPTTLDLWNGSQFTIEYEMINGAAMAPERKEYKKNRDRWSPRYQTRPHREVFYIGIDSCVPDMEIESRTSRIPLIREAYDDAVLGEKIKEKLSFTTEKYRKEADRKITESVLELNEYKSADCVFCYVSTEKEIDTFSILQDILQSGKHLGVPKCTGKGIMNVYEIHSLQELYPGAYGILEPKEDPERLIQPEAIDFAFIPCISCDRSGRRLGHGGGYYDRYLEKTHCVKAALCREELLVDEIPVEEHDLRMDFVISEKGCYKM